MPRPRATLALTGALAAAALAAGLLPSSQAATLPSPHLLRPLAGPDSGTFPGSEVPVGDVDRRGPQLPPLASARAELARLGGDLNVSWTPYGTPLVLTREGDFLTAGLTGSPEAVARGFLTRHAGLYGLSADAVAGLELVSAEPLPQSTTAWVVLLRQKLSGIPLAEDGLVGVGVGVGGRVAYATSSIVPTAVLGRLASTTPKLSPQQAFLAAAKDVGVTKLGLGDLRLGKVDSAGFQTLAAKGLHQLQRTRLRVLPTTDQGARLVYETNVTDVAGGRALAAIGFVDARTGQVLLRRDAVDTLAEGSAAHAGMRSIATTQTQGSPGAFTGTYSATACSAAVPLTGVAAGDQTLAIAVAATNAANDITIKVFRNGAELTTIDTLTSPEAGVVNFRPAVGAADRITAQVCPYDNKATAPFEFSGNYVSTDQAATVPALPGPLSDGTAGGPATWRAFASNPQLPTSDRASADDRYQVCSGKPGASNMLMKDLAGCDYVYADASPLPYDADPVTGLPTFTTLGNNALTSDARASSSLTPGGPFLPPVSPTRDYTAPFNDAWHTSQCDPASILPPDNSNVQAAIVNLFVGHNRAHDFAYRLGLTEKRGALQTSNFGKGGAEGDPEIGNAQNAALTHDAFAVSNQATGPAAGVGLTGRNNANQITLQDGVPGITNQYLFQPIVGFSGPCADGDLDASIFLHEYAHAISNRLIGGPDAGLSGQQGRSMGESWSDLVAIEYLNAFGLAGSRGEDPSAVGAYATGDKQVGIRDYNLAPRNNPLNYSNFGFDTTGAEVHADGEIWNAIQMTVREALVSKYDKTYPSTNKALQKACASGRTATGAVGPTWDKCPGNRRYITYLFDAMIGQVNPAPSMVDMKDLELASILLRDKRDYDTVADAFASRGLGKGASSRTSEDIHPTPSFASPTAAKNARVTYRLQDANTGRPVKGAVFVGMYSARCMPVATTLGGAQPDATADLIAGSYTLTVQAKGYGIQRFTTRYAAGERTHVLKLAQNVASSAYAPDVTANTGGVRLTRALDDTEASMAGFERPTGVAGAELTVRFANGRQTFDKLAVSSLHHPNEKLPEGGTEFGGRLLGIRAFDVLASTDGGKTFTKVYASSDDFFPAFRPRATAPDLLLRTVKLGKPVTADTVKLRVRSNTCTGGRDFNHEQENDPKSASDCRSVVLNTQRVTIAEFQVFRASGAAGPALVARPRTGSAAGGALPATGANTALGLGGLLLLGLASTAWVVRRRTA
ncbi:MAG: peptidase fungalysin [Frankiales bacterium]|nr:peptidase fungalysin [Frankiales bacterium]